LIRFNQFAVARKLPSGKSKSSRRIRETADKLAIRFFDARKDDAELTHSHILSRVPAIRCKA